MSNMIQAAREQVAALTQAAYERAAAEGLLPAGAEVKATIEIPKDVTHGDYASSFAMAGAKALRKAPRQIAEVIVSHLDLAGTFFDKVEIAGPGFLNFTLGSKWYGGVLADIQAEGETYGAVDEGLDLAGSKVLMKAGKSILEVRDKLAARGELQNAALVERCGMEGQRIVTDLSTMDDPTGYFSIILVKEGQA